MSESDVNALLARLKDDTGLRQALRKDPLAALSDRKLGASTKAAIGAATPLAARSLMSKTDAYDVVAGWTKAASCAYTQCGNCSSACTRAGCFPGPGCPKST